MSTSIIPLNSGSGEEGAKTIGGLLKENKTLRIFLLKLTSKEQKKSCLKGTFFFQDNNVQNEGTKAIADALKINTTLEELDLSSTHK